MVEFSYLGFTKTAIDRPLLPCFELERIKVKHIVTRLSVSLLELVHCPISHSLQTFALVVILEVVVLCKLLLLPSILLITAQSRKQYIRPRP